MAQPAMTEEVINRVKILQEETDQLQISINAIEQQSGLISQVIDSLNDAISTQKELKNKNPGDEVLIPDPSFLTYPRQVILAGGKPIWLKPTEELKIDTSNLENYITDKTKAIILNFPSNPTGELMTESELKPIIDLDISLAI